jgi:hypothetical protein
LREGRVNWDEGQSKVEFGHSAACFLFEFWLVKSLLSELFPQKVEVRTDFIQIGAHLSIIKSASETLNYRLSDLLIANNRHLNRFTDLTLDFLLL